jgi:type IV pilus assembly PilO-like protein
MKDKLTPRVVAALAAAAVALVALIGWLGLVSPQHSKASKLDRAIADAKTQLVVAKANAHPRAGGKASGVSGLVLARAMPQQVAMSGVMRQLQRAANRAGVRLDSITPQAATTQSSYSAVPMAVIVTGRYFPIQAFLRDLRTQAGVAGSRVHASGRLFSVDSVSLAAGENQLPQLAATIQLNVFTYSGSAGPGTSATSGVSASDSSTSSSAVAAGSTH